MIADGYDWPSPLFPYQVEGIERLVREPALLLADDMGLGKTIQAIAALRILLVRGAIRQALIVMPLGLILQWRSQLRRWAPNVVLSTVLGTGGERAAAWAADAQVYLVGYESLRSDVDLKVSRGPGRRHWDVAVLDEAQRIKNPKSAVALAVNRLQRTRSWALTGTPLENTVEDIVSILDFVVPGRFDAKAMMVGLRHLLGEVQLRRRRADVLKDLPPKLVSVIPLRLGARQMASYRRARDEGLVRLAKLGRELTITHVLELILRLKQICNFCPESQQSSKLADLAGRLDAIVQAGHKALVFTQFVEEPFGARQLQRELRHLSPILLIGGMSPVERIAILSEFENDSRRSILILSLRAGGVGLNLTRASHVVHFDRWWNPAIETQAEDRAHRIGQQRPVNVHAYLCVGTIEERIEEILQDKRDLFADVVDGVDAAMLRRLDLPTLLGAVERS